MFWKKEQNTGEPPKPAVEKLPGPRSIEELVGRHLVLDLKLDPDWVWQLCSVVRRKPGGAQTFYFRVFDTAQVAAKKIKVKDYTSLDNHPQLTLYEGWFDKVSMEVHFEKQKTMDAPDTAEATATAAAGATPPESAKKVKAL